MNVIAISGKAEAGKDTFATFFKEIVNDKRVLVVHYADYLKFIARQYFDWDGRKDAEGRELLQYLGTDIVRKKSPDFWVEAVIRLIFALEDYYDFVLIPDCRFPNEILLMREKFGASLVSVRITRRGFQNSLTEKQRSHASETALDAFTFDWDISPDNNLDSLRLMAIEFVESNGF